MSTVTTTQSRKWTAPRTYGMATGLGLVLLGAWGALIPFIGPYFHYAYSPDRTWTWTAGRGYLEVLPGVVAFLAGLVVIVTAHRAKASLAAWFGVVAGAWFVVGPLLAPTWSSRDVGTPVGGARMVAVEQIGIFYGLGATIILFAAAALGRFSVVSAASVVTEPEPAIEPAAEPLAAQAVPTQSGPTQGMPTQGMPAMSAAPPTREDPASVKHTWLPGRHRHYAAN